MLKTFVQGLIVVVGLALFLAAPAELSPTAEANSRKKERHALNQRLQARNRLQRQLGHNRRYVTRQEAAERARRNALRK